MVRRRPPLFQHLQAPVAVHCRMGEHGIEGVGIKIIGTGTGNEDAAFVQNPHCPQVYLFIAAVCLLDLLRALGKGRRIQDDHVKLLARRFILLEQVKDVGAFCGHDGPGSIFTDVAVDELDGFFRNIDRNDGLRPRLKGIQAKGSRMGERIQHLLAVAEIPYRHAVELLVKEVAGLLPPCNVNAQAEGVFFDRNDVPAALVDPAALFFQPFLCPDCGVAALVDRLGPTGLDEGIDKFLPEQLAGKCEELHDETAALSGHVALNDEAGNTVSFTENKPDALPVRKREPPHIHGIPHGLRPVALRVRHNLVGMIPADEPDRNL